MSEVKEAKGLSRNPDEAPFDREDIQVLGVLGLIVLLACMCLVWALLQFSNGHSSYMEQKDQQSQQEFEQKMEQLEWDRLYQNAEPRAFEFPTESQEEPSNDVQVSWTEVKSSRQEASTGMTLEDANTAIDNLKPAAIIIKTDAPGLSGGRCLTWNVPANLVVKASVSTINVDVESETKNYKLMTTSNSEALEAINSYILSHPELSPEADGACDLPMDSRNQTHVFVDLRSGGYVEVEPLDTGTLTDTIK